MLMCGVPPRKIGDDMYKFTSFPSFLLGIYSSSHKRFKQTNIDIRLVLQNPKWLLFLLLSAPQASKAAQSSKQL